MRTLRWCPAFSFRGMSSHCRRWRTAAGAPNNRTRLLAFPNSPLTLALPSMIFMISYVMHSCLGSCAHRMGPIDQSRVLTRCRNELAKFGSDPIDGVEVVPEVNQNEVLPVKWIVHVKRPSMLTGKLWNLRRRVGFEIVSDVPGSAGDARCGRGAQRPAAAPAFAIGCGYRGRYHCECHWAQALTECIWHCMLACMNAGSPYEGQCYQLSVTFDEGYPFEPPIVRYCTASGTPRQLDVAGQFSAALTGAHLISH